MIIGLEYLYLRKLYMVMMLIHDKLKGEEHEVGEILIRDNVKVNNIKTEQTEIC